MREPARVNAFVYGLVQGVGFRSFVEKVASLYGVHGWVRNLPNGSVEILAEGDKDTLKLFLEHVQKGPLYASVTRLDTAWDDYRGDLTGFVIRG